MSPINPLPKCSIHKIDMLGSPGGPYCYECDKEFEDAIKKTSFI